MRLGSLVPLFLLLACHGDDKGATSDTTAAWRPDLVCPGDAGCESIGDGQLSAGAAAVPITPTCYETWNDVDGDDLYLLNTDSYNDCGCDHLCPGDPGYTAPDAGEGDGAFEAVWMAGFDNGRPANGVHDDLWARAIALREGDVTLAIVSLDLVGFFNDDVLKIRSALADAGVDVDHLIVTSTHVHEGPDTMGLWGPYAFHTGVDPDYMAYVESQAVEAVTEAVAALQPATMTYGGADTSTTSADKGMRNLVRDSRDPVIVDEDLYAARFAAADGSTIATLINWGNHPESLSDTNLLLTSDYVGYVRDAVENGVNYDSYQVPGVGGTAIFLNAEVGGLMTPLGVEVTDGDGNAYSDSNFDKAQAIGNVIGELTLSALANGKTATAPALDFRMESFELPIENYAFQALAIAKVIDRTTYEWDPTQDITADNLPYLKSEVDLVDLGPIRMMTVPGELFPEIAIGGYDGSHVNTTVVDFIASDNPNPPDVSQAPAGPYLKERMGAEQNWVLGLGNDEVGYIVPAYDFKVDETDPYIAEADGDHYEETNSLGPQTQPLVEGYLNQLLDWTP